MFAEAATVAGGTPEALMPVGDQSGNWWLHLCDVFCPAGNGVKGVWRQGVGVFIEGRGLTAYFYSWEGGIAA